MQKQKSPKQISQTLNYNYKVLKLALYRRGVDFLIILNEYLFVGLLDTLIEKLSDSFNKKLIRFQLEKLPAGQSTGVSVKDFYIGNGCWIATIAIDDDIAEHPLIIPFVIDLVAYATGSQKQAINATKLETNTIKIVVTDNRLSH